MTSRGIAYLIIIIIGCIGILACIGICIYIHFNYKKAEEEEIYGGEEDMRRTWNKPPTKEEYERALKVQQEYYANKEKRK